MGPKRQPNGPDDGAPPRPGSGASLAADLLDEAASDRGPPPAKGNVPPAAATAPDLVLQPDGALKPTKNLPPPAPTLVDPWPPHSAPSERPAPERLGPEPAATVPRDASATLEALFDLDPEPDAAEPIQLDPEPSGARPLDLNRFSLFAAEAEPDWDPPPRLSRPMRVLVVTDDPTEGAELRRMILGIGAECRDCRLTALGEARAHRWDAILASVSPEEARRDGGRNRLSKLSSMAAPVLVLSSVPLALAEPGVLGFLEAPAVPSELVDGLERAQRLEPSIPDPEAATQGLPGKAPDEDELSTQALPSPDEPVRFESTLVRAVVVFGPEDRARGRVRSLSRTGRMRMDLRRPIEASSALALTFTRSGGETQNLSGKVTSKDEEGVEVELALANGTSDFLREYIEEIVAARVPPEQVVAEVQYAAAMALSNEDLQALWEEAKHRLEDDELQQRFIQECLKAQNLEWAVRCYRELKEADATDERAARYLNQVGTILGFYALSRQPSAVDDVGMPRHIKWALGIFVGAAVILAAFAFIAS